MKSIMRRVVEVYRASDRAFDWKAKLTCGHVVVSHAFQTIGAVRRCPDCENGVPPIEIKR